MFFKGQNSLDSDEEQLAENSRWRELRLRKLASQVQSVFTARWGVAHQKNIRHVKWLGSLACQRGMAGLKSSVFARLLQHWAIWPTLCHH